MLLHLWEVCQAYLGPSYSYSVAFRAFECKSGYHLRKRRSSSSHKRRIELDKHRVIQLPASSFFIMPRQNLPPLTSKQAKRLHQKQGQRFTFTPSQYRAAERRELLEERRKQTIAKEQKKKENKRKREEKQEREREAKRQQLAEGKISIEDTWGKVTASQPRLGAFFRKPAAVPSLSTVTEEASPSKSKKPDSSLSHNSCADHPHEAMEKSDATSASLLVQIISQIHDFVNF